MTALKFRTLSSWTLLNRGIRCSPYCSKGPVISPPPPPCASSTPFLPYPSHQQLAYLISLAARSTSPALVNFATASGGGPCCCCCCSCWYGSSSCPSKAVGVVVLFSWNAASPCRATNGVRVCVRKRLSRILLLTLTVSCSLFLVVYLHSRRGKKPLSRQKRLVWEGAGWTGCEGVGVLGFNQ